MASQPPPHPAVPTSNTFKDDIFKGRVLFCTGGGSGICKNMTEAVMSHGADAVIVGRKLERVTASAEELSKKTGRTCIAVQGDVRKPEQLKDAVQKAIDKFGKIDFVICGAAGNFLAPISGMSENAFRSVIEIDTLGTYNTIKATLPHVRKSRGSYIHVSATLHYTGTPYQAHVSAAKAGVDALSNVLAVEEGPRGVRSNVIAPGPIAGTEGMDRLSAIGSGENETSRSVPLQRWGRFDDINNATVFLFSDAACWISGQALAVDGGSWHTNISQLPYPQSVLDPAGIAKLIKPKM